ncbi:MAG: hypothetical protein SF052_05455 [Bacteroidia bacterium]|nr:hypothetical protein [Bacteroidia bacterium]
MVVGLQKFREHFNDYQDSYLVIGGSACDIILEEAGFIPRATDDIDIILIIEALNSAFIERFWEFIKLGNYQVQQKEREKRNCYRFKNSLNEGFPKQIELFCRTPDAIDIRGDSYLTPIPVDEGLSGLSAILLNDAYYQFTKNQSAYKDDIHFAKPESIICLKAYAYLDNKSRKESGQNVQSKDIAKHKNDIFRMIFMLNPGSIIIVPDEIKRDLQKFAHIVKNDLPDPSILKDNGFGKQDMEKVFIQFVNIFELKI